MSFIYNQLFVTPPYPTRTRTGETIIVTGSNVGLGFEASKHFVRLDAARVILAVRSIEKGEAAKKSIEEATGRTGVVEVWKLDLANYDSVKTFAQKASQLERLDVLVENAGLAPFPFKLVEGNEESITTNVVSTFLLALLMLPKLEQTADKFSTTPHLAIVSSEVGFQAKFSERKHPEVFEALANKEKSDMSDRYPTSKLLEILYFEKLAPHVSSKIILNILTPGLCKSDLSRGAEGLTKIFFMILKALLARTTEVGSRTLVYAASAGPETHGKYLANCKVSPLEGLATPGDEATKLEERVWTELNKKLELIAPGVTKILN